MQIIIKNNTNYFFYPISIILSMISLIITILNPNKLYIITDILLILAYLYVLQCIASKRINTMIVILLIVMITIILKNLNFIDFNISQMMNLDTRTIINEGKNILLVIFMMVIFSIEDNVKKLTIILNDNSRLIKIFLILNQILQLIFLITKKGFVILDQEVFFAGSIGYYHQFAYLMIFTTIITICLYKNNKIKNILLWLIIPTILIVISGARTATISYFLIVLVIFNLNFKIDSKFIIFIVAIILSIMFFPNNTFIEKMISTSAEKSILSGREIFWNIDLIAYKSIDFFSQCFGKGIFFTRFINYKGYGMMIWAHNDFIELLICQGSIFLLFYITLLIIFLKNMIKNSKRYSICVILSVFILMCFNGFYTYTYSILIIPFLNILIKERGVYEKL